MKQSLILVLMLVILGVGCKEKKDKYTAFAEDFCKCMEPMAELQKKYITMMESGDPSGMDTFLEEASKQDEESQVCMAELEKKHGLIQGEQEEALTMEALRKVCPDIVAMMEQQSAGPEMMPEAPLEEPAEDGGNHDGHDHN